jgi:hypothetical protein
MHFAIFLSVNAFASPPIGRVLAGNTSPNHGFTPKFNAQNMFPIPQTQRLSLAAELAAGERL